MITHLNSATQIIQLNNVKILTDPWLGEGVFHNSWFGYPLFLKKNLELLNQIDFVYISHIHEDHCSEQTLMLLDKNTPCIILEFSEKALYQKLERIGFKRIIEIKHNNKTHLQNEVFITILAADNCNPEICNKAFGCFMVDNKKGNTYQIDSMCIIENHDNVILNTNDSPYMLSFETIKLIQSKYNSVDFMLVGYTGASLYPFSMIDYTHEKMIEAKDTTKIKGLNQAFNFIKSIKPKYYMPHAGTYLLGGTNWKMNKYSPIPELEESKEYLNKKLGNEGIKSKCVLLNQGESFDLKNDIELNEYVPIDIEKRNYYIKKVLSQKKHDYEKLKNIDTFEVEKLIPKAFERLKIKMKSINFKTETKVYITYDKDRSLLIDLRKSIPNYKIVSFVDFSNPFNEFILDKRLFFNILRGPRYAHWNSVEGGALLKLRRVPDVYEQGIHLSLCYLHI